MAPVIGMPDPGDCTSNDAACAGEGILPRFERMIDSKILNRAIRRGFVELGPECTPAVGRIGFQLTAQGWICAKSEMTGGRYRRWAN